MFSRSVLSKSVLLKALRTAIIVGSILVLINQYDALFGAANINWLKLILTYCVPFCVFLYGASQNQPCSAKSDANSE